MCVWVKLCSHGEMNPLQPHSSCTAYSWAAQSLWEVCSCEMGQQVYQHHTLPISPDRKYLAKIPHAVKIYALILHICLLSSLTKYANVIGPPLLANAWIWPQEKGGNGTYLNKCFFSYCKNDSRHCKNDSRQSDYILFSTKVDLIAINNTVLL